MLTIRREQMRAFQSERETVFRARLLERLKQVTGSQLSEDDLRGQIDRGLESGRRFFSTERDLARYAELVLTRIGGWSQADHPAPVLELLGSHAVSAERRLSNVEYWLAKNKKCHAG